MNKIKISRSLLAVPVDSLKAGDFFIHENMLYLHVDDITCLNVEQCILEDFEDVDEDVQPVYCEITVKPMEMVTKNFNLKE